MVDRLQNKISVGIFTILIAGSLILLLPRVSTAEPYIAVREGLKCSACHVNATGGGKRTDQGSSYGQSVLSSYYIPWEAPQALPLQSDGKESSGTGDAVETGAGFFTGRLHKHLAVGTDFRTSNTTTFPPRGARTNSFEVTEGNLYVEFDLIGSHLILYLDEQLVPGNAQTREAFALVRHLPGEVYLKAGKFFLPYGLRLQDDDAFIRQIPGINMQTPDIGLEIGLEPGPFSLSASITNGTQGAGESNLDKQLALRASYIHRRFRAGGSVFYNESPGRVSRLAYNLFGGVALWRLSVLAEFDRIFDSVPGTDTNHFATLIEANVLIAKGLNAKLMHEFYNPNLSAAEDERERWSVVLEWFPVQYAQLRAGGRINIAPPPNTPANTDELFFEVHLYL